MLRNAGWVSFGIVSRSFATVARQRVNGNLLKSETKAVGQRFMSGHGPDISKMQAALYILLGGGSFAAFGMYQANSMRDRIEAFETGKTIPFKTMTDEEYLEYKQKFKEIHSEE